ncbi:hypothetical protein [Sporomusa acidovorans]|uniref:Transcriptional regulator n=1 Tax=Sporomusa acidovorans (strain ATCC 49682 / DSM 3132 / Mol) TaxID=1123286 RepID=A0ABZ3J0U9_SPOA4|nr:hypothetical protein [Sporomusa acidovorans]OZC22758.1 hypothetical protein SPACI_10660 [Sporomusa acidovorans DSM 3132]SDE50081.1 hypothetical protein SAMN04488499_10151 [Sporomusa acidovorans]
MSKIGIVGPYMSVERILNIAKKMKLNIEFVPLPYAETSEVSDIVKLNVSNVKGWLFSGLIPYIAARKVLSSDAIISYCPRTSYSIYKCILQMIYHQKKIVKQFSFDMYEFIDEAVNLNELVIPDIGMITKYYGRERIDSREIVQFHLDLFKTGKADGAITTLQSVYLALKQEGVSVYHVDSSIEDIRHTINNLVEKINVSYFKEGQVASEVIEIADFDKIIQKSKTSYELQHLELRLKNIILPLCEKVSGYVVEKGDGRYEIFSSRGRVEKEITVLQEAIEQVSVDVDRPVFVGIGFGNTVYAASKNAYQALEHAKKKEQPIVIIQDDGFLVEYMGQKEELMYDYFSDDKELLEKLHQASVSIKTYKKIAAMIRRKGWNSFTAVQLSEELKVTDRNVRRIIASLCKVGLFECIGEEDSSVRGRPSKVYCLK